MDTSTAGGSEKDESKPSSGRSPARAYAPAVLDESQPRLTDLIPQRAFVLVMLALVGLTAIASIECLYIHLYVAILHGVSLPGIDLGQRGNVAHWFSSLVMATGSGLSIAIYSIRVHRVDDYRGRYRVWLWMSAALLLASLHIVTGVHHSVNAACLLVSGMGPEGLGAHLWMLPYGIAAGCVGLWLAIELWPSLEAFGAFATAATLCVLALVAEVGLFPLEGVLIATVAKSSVMMLTHGMFVYSLTLYARHVHLDAQGRLLVQVEKTKRKRAKSSAKLAVVGGDEATESRKKKSSGSEKSAAGNKEAAAGGSSAANPKPAGASISAATLKSPASVKPLAVADDDEDGAEGDKLSRAERRRLKKLAQQGDQRDEQRRAA